MAKVPIKKNQNHALCAWFFVHLPMISLPAGELRGTESGHEGRGKGAYAAVETIRLAEASAGTGSLIGSAPQLAERNSSRAQGGGNDGCEQRGLGDLSQHSSYLSFVPFG